MPLEDSSAASPQGSWAPHQVRSILEFHVLTFMILQGHPVSLAYPFHTRGLLR